MLALARKVNQSIMIGDDIEITLLEIKGDQVKIGTVHQNPFRFTEKRFICRFRKKINRQDRKSILQRSETYLKKRVKINSKNVDIKVS